MLRLHPASRRRQARLARLTFALTPYRLHRGAVHAKCMLPAVHLQRWVTRRPDREYGNLALDRRMAPATRAGRPGQALAVGLTRGSQRRAGRARETPTRGARW